MSKVSFNDIPSQRQVARAFAKALRSCRSTEKVSQEELAHRAGLDRTYPSLLERGLRQPTIGRLIAIGIALHIDPSLLVTMTVVRLREGKS